MTSPETNKSQAPGAEAPHPGFFRRVRNRIFSWQMARRALIGLAVLFTLIAIVWVFEGIRGKRAWKKFQAEMAAAGETLDPDDLKPKPVPDDLNFAMTPLLAPLLDYEYTTADLHVHGMPRPNVVWRDSQAKERLDDFKGVDAHREIPVSDRHKRLLTNLADWQAAIRGDTNFSLPADKISKAMVRETDGPGSETSYDTNFAAQEILLALKQFDAEMAELHAAAKRPYAQFPIHYDEGFATLLPHLQILLKFTRIAQLKAVALLAENRPDEALEELLLIIRFTESFREEPFLISGLVQIHMNSQVSGLVWEGVARGRWKPEHLAAIERRLRKADLVSSFQLAIRGERAMAVKTLIDYRYNWEEMVGDHTVGSKVLRWAPCGVYYQNLVNLGRMYGDFLLQSVDFHRKIIDLQKSKAADERMQKVFGDFNLYCVCAKALFPAFNKALQRYAEGQAEIDQARLACAIEQFRVRFNRLPSDLTELAPDFIPTIPHDPVNGENYVYAPEGKAYLLYSMGADGQDDGAQVEWAENKPNKRLRDRGDWVWNSAPARASTAETH